MSLFICPEEGRTGRVLMRLGSLEQSVKDDIKVLRENKFVRKEIDVRGFVYDIEDGKMQEVKEDSKL